MDKCRDTLRLKKAVEQLTDRMVGLERNIAKGRRRIAEVEGQVTFDEWVNLTKRSTRAAQITAEWTERESTGVSAR